VLLSCLDDFMGPRWEEMYRAHLRRLAPAGVLGSQVVAIGSWWTDVPDVEIDAVALAGRARTPVLVGEAKWARSVDARRILDGLRLKASRLPEADLDRLRFSVCARERVDFGPSDVLAITAAEVMAPD
jgi:hypothetical protein